MLRNERERSFAKRQLLRLSETRNAYITDSGLDPAQRTLLIGGLDATIASVEGEIADYEALASGHLRPDSRPLSEIGVLLIQARIAAGLSQRGLAERLGVSEQRVQQDEASNYGRAGLDRLLRVAMALGLALSVTPHRQDDEEAHHEGLPHAVASS